MKLIKTIGVLILVSLSLGCITVEDSISSSPTDSKVGIYVQIDEKSAAFDLSEIQVKIGNKTINDFNKPNFVGYASKTNGEVEVTFVVNVNGKDWYGKKVSARDLINLKFPHGEKILITLELYYEDETLRIKAETEKSGIIGEKIPDDVFMSSEEALVKEIQRVYGEVPNKIKEELKINKKIREEFLSKYSETGNLTYLRSYRDSFYAIRAFGELAKWKGLSMPDIKAFNLTLKGNNEYYSRYSSPQKDFSVVIFSDNTPYYSPIRIKGALNTSLPFLYYRGRGLSYYPVSAIHWAEIYFKRGNYEIALQFLNNLQEFIYFGNYNSKDYALFLNYFHFENSSIPWVSGYAQGMGAGLYAKAYQITKNETYLKIAKLLLNSFQIPYKDGGFVVEYPYGLWILEYAYNPNELVLNGHIIALQGLYYYWEITKDPYAKELFDNGTTSIAKALPDFEKDGWSLYSNIHGRAMRRYHELHIQLLEWLYEKTENEIFKEYAERWKSSL